MNTNGPGNVLTTISDRKKRLAGATPAFEAVIETAQDYYPFGSLMPGRKYNAGEYRFGFNGMEKDDEIAGVTGSHLDFGARVYDSRIATFLSIDPKAGVFPYQSPYIYANRNPIYVIDVEGKSGVAYKTNEVNKATGHPILKVVSNLYIYGTGANDVNRDKIQNQREMQWNNGGNYFTYTSDDGILYDVVFEMKTEIIDKKDIPAKMWEGGELNAENNFYEIRNDISESMTFSYFGGNTGVIKQDDIDKHSVSHEENHGYNGKNKDRDFNYHTIGDIAVTQGNSTDPSKRRVKQTTVDEIFKKVKFDKDGKGNVGNPRPFIYDETNLLYKSKEIEKP